MSDNANNCEECQRCRYRDGDGGWCYMFRDRPDELPCPQHNKYDNQRRIVSDLVLHNPLLLAGMVQQAVARK